MWRKIQAASTEKSSNRSRCRTPRCFFPGPRIRYQVLKILLNLNIGCFSWRTFSDQKAIIRITIEAGLCQPVVIGVPYIIIFCMYVKDSWVYMRSAIQINSPFKNTMIQQPVPHRCGTTLKYNISISLNVTSHISSYLFITSRRYF